MESIVLGLLTQPKVLRFYFCGGGGVVNTAKGDYPELFRNKQQQDFANTAKGGYPDRFCNVFRLGLLAHEGVCLRFKMNRNCNFIMVF